jgi:23S rRNA (cytidine1920-2'-O)/16S rRNA (cytidine1409-2'-O)-methyltransferase
VSRGGVKLAHALEAFAVDAKERYCLDIGASTGGFTDALLRAGARHVVAVDVGHDQLHQRLRADPRVTSLEGLDARALAAAHLGEAPSLIVVDASFISLALVLPPVLPLAAAGAELLALVKPQFEAGRKAGKKGVVRDEAVHAQVCARVSVEVETLRWRVLGVIASPIAGGDGNREFLLHARRM